MVLVLVEIVEAANRIALHIPDADAATCKPSRNQPAIGGDSNCRNFVCIFDCQSAAVVLEIPQANSPVATRRYRATVSRKVDTKDIFLMAKKGVPDGTGSDVPDLVDVSQELAGVVTD